MLLLLRNPLILLLCVLFLGCESKKTYDIGSDQVINDLNLRITSLGEDLTQIQKEIGEVEAVLNDTDIDAELRKNIRREIHEGKIYEKVIIQHLDYLKIRRKKRYQSLLDRKKSESLQEEAKKETEAYFIDKKLNPIKKPWVDRFRTAIEL